MLSIWGRGGTLSYGDTGPAASMRVTLVVAAVLLAVPGCSRGSESPPRPDGFISEATWPDDPYPSAGPRPFTVAEGVLICHTPHRVTFTADGVEYALNGAAKSSGQFQDVAAIWRDAGPGYVEIGGTRVGPPKPSLGLIIVRGLDLCPNPRTRRPRRRSRARSEHSAHTKSSCPRRRWTPTVRLCPLTYQRFWPLAAVSVTGGALGLPSPR